MKVLRFLQEGTYTPVGAREARHADVRIVSATHRDLEAMIATGTFREDLYYRPRGVVIRTPALDERREDLGRIAAHFLAQTSKKRRLRFSQKALAWLVVQSWPGNVRELKATIECAAALADPAAPTISAEDLYFARGGGAPPSAEAAPETLPQAMENLERRMIGAALTAADHNHSAASGCITCRAAEDDDEARIEIAWLPTIDDPYDCRSRVKCNRDNYQSSAEPT